MNTRSYRATVKGACAVTIALATSAAPLQARAAVTGNLDVSATVAASCVVSSTQALAFGTYDSVTTHATTPLDASGTVTTICTAGTAAVIRLDQGVNPNTGSTDAAPLRRAANGINMLSYALYSEATHTTAWGNTTPTGLADTGDGAPRKLTVYGRMAAGQRMPVGSYVDTVIAAVDF